VLLLLLLLLLVVCCIEHWQEELRERDQEVAGLAAANSRYDTQIAGLQTLLVTKVAQCNRLDKEVKELSKQLRQAEAAAAAGTQTRGQQLAALSDRVAGLQDELACSQRREQQLEVQVVATRAKVGIV